MGGTRIPFAVHALIAAMLGASAIVYARGVTALWSKAGSRRGVSAWRAGAFAAGLLVVGAALLSPLHHHAEERLWAHMVQHELLMVVAAPLLVLGRPLEIWTWALPRAWRPVARLTQPLGDTGLAWALHAAAIWIWHVPTLFEAALANPWLHAAQHASFLGSALLFWWSLFAPGPRQLAGMASLFTTMLHTGALGALMTLARASWYPGFSLEDQQLAGLVMWVPAGLAYPFAALVLGSRWLHRSAA
jgi:putative membrane protein